MPETLEKETRVLCRKHIQGPKHQPVWEEGRILRRVASNMYEVAVPDRKGELYARVEHTRNLKRLANQSTINDVHDSSDDEAVSPDTREIQDFRTFPTCPRRFASPQTTKWV